jgi:GNAT superfamily N-acetyltransferase
MQINDAGYSDLPKGKIINIATFLDMRVRPPRPHFLLDLTRITPSVEEYLTFYRKIGAPWLWYSRLTMPREKLEQLLHSPNLHIYFLEDYGLLELDFTMPNECETECEIAYFGLCETAIGQGLGKKLMDFAIHTAFLQPISRLWVHTCTIDHPKALDFYLNAGFIPYKRAIEIDDDPRLLGLMDKKMGAHYPLI